MSETVCVRKRGEDIARLCVTESINMRVRQKAGVCGVEDKVCVCACKVRIQACQGVSAPVRLCECEYKWRERNDIKNEQERETEHDTERERDSVRESARKGRRLLSFSILKGLDSRPSIESSVSCTVLSRTTTRLS